MLNNISYINQKIDEIRAEILSLSTNTPKNLSPVRDDMWALAENLDNLRNDIINIFETIPE